ncbi:uncharacterized protein Z519_06768 [Cladophialophora bantiana CBS 173.52]|uniref:SMP-30/Gluconolactonase/LRE-like region domain-containing protein n=1 Tax=Cladophialophora bantiana (strain ATCC 10958 / CBS 173.52 / CDC B-1940 / NIH 8579) TaxID=1442370 RepID=A0A0D2I7Y6_CLAB1|nr:uncharacterized protein Z519_06768 [Cladophialophora bantiana CBS 173.52]KIW92919.1 hypothetical protein Z519_06768 [Cladophialophora bantiana CBS 173.52]
MTSSTNTEVDNPPFHVPETLPERPPRYTTIATFPPGSFLENLAVRRDGSILASDMLSGSIWYIDPHVEDGNTQKTVELVHKFEVEGTLPEESFHGDDGKAEAASEAGEGEIHASYASTPAAEAIVESPTEPDLFYLFSGIHGKKGTWSVYELDMRSFVPAPKPTQMTVRCLAPVPAVTWLNGGTAIPHPTVPLILMAESYQGRLYSYNIKTGAVGVWLEHPLLGKMTTRPRWPGVNGLQYYHDGKDSWVYFTNSDRAILGRMRVDQQGDVPVATRDPDTKKIEIQSLASGCGGDDLCLDGEGNIYVATNPMNTVLKFPQLALPLNAAPGQEEDAQPPRQIVLGLRRTRSSAEEASIPKPDSPFEIDPDTTGPTAVAFGITAADERDLYVVTNGGIVNPLDGVVRDARVLRVHL